MRDSARCVRLGSGKRLSAGRATGLALASDGGKALYLVTGLRKATNSDGPSAIGAPDGSGNS